MICLMAEMVKPSNSSMGGVSSQFTTRANTSLHLLPLKSSMHNTNIRHSFVFSSTFFIQKQCDQTIKVAQK